MMAAATAVTQHVVVGKGRVGEALQKMLPEGNTVMVGRTDAIPADGAGPIYVATRNDDLATVIEKTPEGRRKDLVFMQNGMLGPFLEGYGLQDNTQVSLLGSAPLFDSLSTRQGQPTSESTPTKLKHRHKL